jgi:AraC family transcriptional regulator
MSHPPTILMRSARTPSVVVAEFRLPPNFRVPTHDHGPPHIAVVLAGAMLEHGPSGSDVFHAGYLRYSPAGDVHHVETLDEGTHVVVIEAFGFPQLQLNRRVIVGPDRAGLLIELFRERLFHSPVSSPGEVEESALALFTMIRRSARRGADTRPWLEVVRSRIASRDGWSDNLDDLATLAGCHRTFLARSFRAWYGVSIGEYRRRCRLQATWRLLADERVPLGTVAIESGFTDQSHMTRVFQRDVGHTPATVRARLTGMTGSWFTSHPLAAL